MWPVMPSLGVQDFPFEPVFTLRASLGLNFPTVSIGLACIVVLKALVSVVGTLYIPFASCVPFARNVIMSPPVGCSSGRHFSRTSPSPLPPSPSPPPGSTARTAGPGRSAWRASSSASSAWCCPSWRRRAAEAFHALFRLFFF